MQFPLCFGCSNRLVHQQLWQISMEKLGQEAWACPVDHTLVVGAGTVVVDTQADHHSAAAYHIAVEDMLEADIPGWHILLDKIVADILLVLHTDLFLARLVKETVISTNL